MNDDEKLDLAASLYIDQATNNLFKYSQLMWPVLEPGKKYVDGWHIHAICEHLQAVADGEIRNLLINVPPGHMKSLLVCVLFPSWLWIKYPSKRIISASYAQTLSTRDSVKTRDVIRSERYQKLFRPKWALKDDQDQKTRYTNTSTGYRIATSVGGSGTGERADVILCDDPLNAIDSESELIRQQSLDWWFQTMSTRDSDPKTTARIVVMQRLHEKDLAGEIIKRGGYEHLMLPAEYAPKRKCTTSLGWEDPRKKDGELLWPEQYGPDQIEKAKKDLGGGAYSKQFQQNPLPSEGGLFKRNWWKFYKEKPAPGQILEIAQFWDTAQKPGITNDYSVGVTWARTQNGYYLLDLFRAKLEYPQLKQAIKGYAAKWQPNAVQIEDKVSGTSLIQDLRQETNLPIIAYNPGQRDKQVRASAATPTVQAGNCYLPEQAPWVEDFIIEHERFPDGENDDQVDTTSQMVDYFRTKQSIQPRVRQL